MSGRRSFPKVRGIRKRRGKSKGSAKNKPDRQRLAKVVAREEARGEYFRAKAASREPCAPQIPDAGPSNAAFSLSGAVAFEDESEPDDSPSVTVRGAYEALIETVLPASRKDAALVHESTVVPTERFGNKVSSSQADSTLGIDTSSSMALEVAESSADLSGDAARRESGHFAFALEAEAAARLESNDYVGCKAIDVAHVGRVSLVSPETGPSTVDEFVSRANINRLFVNSLGLQPSLLRRWRRLRTSSEKEGILCPDSCLSRREAMYTLGLRSFRDVLFCHSCAPEEERRIRQLTAAHCLSHALRARGRVQSNNRKLNDNGVDSLLSEDAMRDQGFSRARVLLLAPMRNDAYDIIRLVCELAVGTDEGQEGVAQVGNRERFEAEFGQGPDSEDCIVKGGEQAVGDSYDSQVGPRPSLRSSRKPEDWNHRFRGNADDDFKIGISLTKKSIRLYSDFYDSDIIVASPLGLVRSMEAKKSGVSRKARMSHEQKDRQRAEQEWSAGQNQAKTVVRSSNFAKQKNDEDDDSDGFLSSIEICVIDGADTFGMQNWSLVPSVMELVNNMPASPRETDFSRVRTWALDNLMRYYRQTVVLSKYRRPDILSFFRGQRNHGGCVRILPLPVSHGSISDVFVSARQRFLRIGSIDTPRDEPELRLDCFMRRIVPEVRSSVDCQALVVVPSYFDFVRVRNRLLSLAAEEVSFQVATMSEYSKESDVARAKTRFFNEKVKMLVMTERIHFYWRSRVRGANTIVWYSLPENAHFYPEIVNLTAEMAEKGRPVQSIALYDELDALALERIVGTSRCKKMISSSARSMYLFT